MRVVSLALVLLLTSAWPLVAQRAPLDYPQWRGLERDGAASGFVEPAAWPKALTRRWRVEVGEGYGTPLVVGDAVYVFTRRDGQEIMSALDASTGKQRWHSSYPAPYSPSQPTAAHGSGPKATPLFRDGKIFTLGISGIMSAFDAATGAILWQTGEPAEHPFFSAASSPAGEANLVFAHPGNYGPLTAFDPASGTVKWTAGDGGFFMSPLITTLEGTRQVVTVTQGGVTGVAVPDGRVLWTYVWTGGRNGGSMPVLYGETVIVASAEGMLAVRPSIRGGQWVVEKVWESKEVSLYLSNPVVVGDAIYGLSTRDRGRFFALDARDGTVLWLGEPRAATNTAIVKAGELLVLLNDGGELIVAKASRRGFEPVARYTVADSATWAQPAISGQRLFIKDVNSLSLWTLE